MDEEELIIFHPHQDEPDPELKRQMMDDIQSGMTNGQYQEIKHLIPRVKEMRIREAAITYQNESFFHVIADIHFPQLTKLYLNNDKIDSIEGFARFRLPLLRSLTIFQNKLSIIRDFRKSSWPSLQCLYFQNNDIVDGYRLVEMQGKQLRDLTFQYFDHDRNQVLDIGWVVKLEGKIDELEIDSKWRINQSSVKKKLSKRYFGLHLNTYQRDQEMDFA